MKNNKGFSLVELIVVIAIMAILAAVAIPTFATFINKANVAADEDFMAGAEYAISLANTANPDFKLVSVSVTVDDNGGFSAVAYTYNTNETGSVPETVVNTTAQADADASEVIDWSYTFKAYKGKTVTYTIATDTVTAQ